VTDGRTTKYVLNDINGIGTGRVYYTYNHPEEACKNLPSAWPLDQKTNNCATPLDKLNYLGDVAPTPSSLRQAVPGGGTMVNNVPGLNQKFE